MSKFKAAIIQHPPVFMNLDGCVEKAEKLIKEAAGEGAEVIAFPETWFPGYPVWLDSAPMAAVWGHEPAKALYSVLRANSMQIPGPHFNKLLKIAREACVVLIISVNELYKGTIYNTTAYIGRDGESYKIHRKLVPTFSERLVWGRGDGSGMNVLETEYGVIGGLICWEHWMPAARAVMHSKNEILHVACWPSAHELHQLASRTYAFEGGCFVLACGTVMSMKDVLDGFDSLGKSGSPARELLVSMPFKNEELILNGGSAVIGPDSKYLAGPVYDKPSIIYADLDTETIGGMKMLLDTDGHYSRPDIFTITVDTKAKENVAYLRKDNVD